MTGHHLIVPSCRLDKFLANTSAVMLQHPQKYTGVEHADLLLNPENRKAKNVTKSKITSFLHTYTVMYKVKDTLTHETQLSSVSQLEDHGMLRGSHCLKSSSVFVVMHYLPPPHPWTMDCGVKLFFACFAHLLVL